MKKLKKYWPDLIILIGIGITSYNLLRLPSDPFSINLTDYHTEWKVLGILLVTLGIDIAIRRYVASKNR